MRIFAQANATCRMCAGCCGDIGDTKTVTKIIRPGYEAHAAPGVQTAAAASQGPGAPFASAVAAPAGGAAVGAASSASDKDAYQRLEALGRKIKDLQERTG